MSMTSSKSDAISSVGCCSAQMRMPDVCRAARERYWRGRGRRQAAEGAQGTPHTASCTWRMSYAVLASRPFVMLSMH